MPRTDWLRATSKAIPYINDTLDELLFGRLEEARRMELVLSEIARIMQVRGIPARSPILRRACCTGASTRRGAYRGRPQDWTF